jgi:hypothetical protein
MTRNFRIPLYSCLLLLAYSFMPLAVNAQTPTFLGSYVDWNVYEFDENNQKICYMASVPKKQTGTYTRRGNPAVLVTRRPGPQPVNEVSVQPGYTYLVDSKVEVSVDTGGGFELFTRGEHAWTINDEQDAQLITAMRRGSTMTITGTSSKQTTSEDTYSLLGFTKAFNAMETACNSN